MELVVALGLLQAELSLIMIRPALEVSPLIFLSFRAPVTTRNTKNGGTRRPALGLLSSAILKTIARSKIKSRMLEGIRNTSIAFTFNDSLALYTPLHTRSAL